MIDLDDRKIVGDVPLPNYPRDTLLQFTLDGRALTFVEQQKQDSL